MTPGIFRARECSFGVVIADMDNSIIIESLRSIREFYEEGQAIHHCEYTNAYYNEK